MTRLLAPLVAHVLVSTLFLAIVLLAVVVLRHRLTASARFALALIGILKFALPSSVVALALPQQISVVAITAPLQTLTQIGTRVAPPAASMWPGALLMIWLAVAVFFILATSIARGRLVSLALATAKPADEREAAALSRARARMNVRRSIDIVRSTAAEAPAVLRVLRPVVILPAAGCRDLSDEELESLLRHECAHVRRHDNFTAFVESVICALFWFHPLIWLAQRITVIERERACDEVVADSADERETYLEALAKFCHASIVPRLPGVSCMATARLKERMDHVKDFGHFKLNAIAPRRVAIAGAAALMAYTLIAGFTGSGLASAAVTPTDKSPYSIKLVSYLLEGQIIELHAEVTDNAGGTVLANPTLRFPVGTNAEAHSGNSQDKLEVTVRVPRGGTAAEYPVEVIVEREGSPKFERTMRVISGPRPAPRPYQGSPISMDLKDADIRDVLGTFSKLTGIKMVIDESVTGTVTVNWVDVPWDKALEEILRDNGLTWKLEGSTMYVKKRY